MNSQETRCNWLDIAKGITIMLMVMGHSSIPHSFAAFIWAFHMPLFFIAAGWTTNWEKRTFFEYCIHRTKTLMLPFVSYSIIVCLILSHHNSWKGVGYLLSHGWEGYPLWFIPVLFVASVISRAVYEVKSTYFRLMLIFSLAMVGVVLDNNNIYLPWAMSSVPYASFLVAWGGYIKHIVSPEKSNKIWILLCFAITLGISLFYRLDMAWNNITPVIPLTIGAVSGTIMVFMLSSLIEKKCKTLSKIL
ncbi:hypothetical protein CIK90_02185, partial [Prevotella sp. P5-126]|uniref:acyltransferase family protein n=1 Tax=Prevotella sp. P5-126 TaxID=2024216 RepID=UPI000B95FF96